MSDIDKLTKLVKQFEAERDWKKHHGPKDAAISILIEAAELAEHFQYRQGKELDEYIKAHKEDIGDELSDVFHWVLLIAEQFDIDLVDAFKKKMQKNAKKYPVKQT